MTIVKHKRGTGIPSPDDVEVGEIAIDTSTGTAYTKASDGSVVSVGGDGGSDGGGSGGGWQLLATASASSSASVEFDQITDEFDDYKIIISGVKSSDNSTELRMQARIATADGLDEYKTKDYGWHVNRSNSASTNYVGKSDNGQSGLPLFTDYRRSHAPGPGLEVSVFGVHNSLGPKSFSWVGFHFHTGLQGELAVGGGYQKDIGSLTGIRFLMSTGVVAEGTFKLYGIKK